MTDKLLIHLNKNIANIETNKNNEIKYNLKNPIKLNVGDTITLYQSFINERGLSGDTFSLQEDYKMSLRYLYYIEGGTEFKMFYPTQGKDNDGGDITTNQWIFQYRNASAFYAYAMATDPDEETFYTLNDPTQDQDGLFSATDPGGYYIMFRMYWDNDLQKIKLLPQLGAYEFIIPSGNYSPSSLSQYITDRMNGLNNKDNTDLYLNNVVIKNLQYWYENYEHPLVQKIDFSFFNLNSIKSAINGPDEATQNFEDTIFPLYFYNFCKTTFVNNWSQVGDALDGFPLFINCTSANEMLFNFYNNDQIPYWEDYYAKDVNVIINRLPLTVEGLFPYGGMYYPVPVQVLASNGEELPNGDIIINAGDLISSETYRTIGCKEFNLIYEGGTKNRFSFTNLHTPLKMPSHDQKGNPNQAIEGQQITKINYLSNIIYTQNTEYAKGYIPKHSNGGIMILSFCEDIIKDNIPGYDLQWNNIFDDLGYVKEPIYMDKDVLAFLSYFTSDDIIEENNIDNLNFEKIYNKSSIWARMGFSYQQIFNVRNNLTTFSEYTTGDIINTLGMITFNEENLSTQEGISSLGYSLVANSVPVQLFDSSGLLNDISIEGFKNKSAFDVNQPISAGINFNVKDIFITTTSKYISADNLPDLMANDNYYIIESDIVKNNYLDCKGNYNSVIGIISLENSNQDTLFSTDAIDFTLTESKILSSIKIKITNPDGTDIPNNIINQNSAFIFMIQKDLSNYFNLINKSNNKKK